MLLARKHDMRTSPPPADRIPVIVGIGEITDRPGEITDGLEPLALLVEALKRAEANSGAALLGGIDSLDVVNFLSWRYRDPEKLLSSRLGIHPKHAYYGPVGGESNVAAVCGAEAQSTATRAERAASPCRGRRSRMMSKSPNAARHFRSRWPSSSACSAPSASIRFTRRLRPRIGARPRARRWPNPGRCGRSIRKPPLRIPTPGSNGASRRMRLRRHLPTTG